MCIRDRHTPIILSRARLEKMGVFDGSIMEKQVFWIDSKRCLRPMLAPHLYEYMREVGRLRPRPVRLFEVGPCFRRETQGQRHANEFTMLNLVEMGLPEGTDLNARLRELGAMVLDAAGIEGWRMTDEDSAVYGETSDFVDKNGMELASSALGPHPLDAAWGIMENWVGIGFGLERLTMAATGESTMAKTGRSLSYLHGIRLRLSLIHICLLAVSKERFLGKKCQGYPGMTGSGGFRSGGMRRITPNCLSSLVQLRNQQRSPLRLPQR